ncbi:hypothetical protein CDL15_Pgr016501 [Punica granatum]|uniref:Uncharacterized protein n=1 Tax=Punica granatum TaxID=22663 RepID=A0A218WL27_PUNGR|nr:hypothetical protein CDL15_Pgr016501 [Punica granatum]
MLGDALARLPTHARLRPRSHSSVTTRVPVFFTASFGARVPRCPLYACLHMHARPHVLDIQLARSRPLARPRLPRPSNLASDVLPRPCTSEHALPRVLACPNV